MLGCKMKDDDKIDLMYILIREKFKFLICFFYQIVT